MNRFALLTLVGLMLLSACGDSRPESRMSRREAAREDRGSGRAERNAQEPSEAEAEAAAPAAATGRVVLSGLRERDGAFSVTLNGVLAVDGVKILSGQNGEFLAFPRRRDDNNRYWNYIRVGRGDADALFAAVKEKTFSQQPSGFAITRTDVNLVESTGRRKAFVEFELEGGAVVLYSWALVEGRDGLFLVGPSEKAGADWKDIVFAVDRDFRRALSEAAFAAYKAKGGQGELAPPREDSAPEPAGAAN